MPRILLVEDEPAIAETVLYALRMEGFEAQHCLTGSAALARSAAGALRPGGARCRPAGHRRLRPVPRTAPGRDLPVIFLTAHDAEAERILGLEIGADDYVAKPFSPRELVARVRAVLRRQHAAAEAATARLLGFEHDAEGHRIRYRGRLLDLTRYEYGLLAALLQRPGAVLSRAQLMDRVWGDALDSGDRTIDTHIKTLRAKLRVIAPEADPIRTHRGLGYSLETRAERRGDETSACASSSAIS